jgi:hypothetical protein
VLDEVFSKVSRGEVGEIFFEMFVSESGPPAYILFVTELDWKISEYIDSFSGCRSWRLIRVGYDGLFGRCYLFDPH